MSYFTKFFSNVDGAHKNRKLRGTFVPMEDAVFARAFLKQVRMGHEQSPITTLWTESGLELSIDEASDFQVLSLANELKKAMWKAGQL